MNRRKFIYQSIVYAPWLIGGMFVLGSSTSFGIFNLYLFYFLLWIIGLWHISSKKSHALLAAVFFILVIPIMLIFNFPERRVEDLAVYILELLTLGLIQELILLVKENVK